MRIGIIQLILLLFASQSFVSIVKAQDSTSNKGFDFRRLKPIVQVFGTAGYNFENSKYEYSIGRAHLGTHYEFNKNWGATIIIDRGRATSVGTITVVDSTGNQLQVLNTSKEGAYYTMFLKFASVHWKVNDKLKFDAGAILQNHYITQEHFWGLRYVAQTFQDLYWKIPSSDLGFIGYYRFGKVVSLDAAITNGEGPRIKQDAFGKIKFATGLDINLSQKIQTRLYYHNKQTGIDTLTTEQMISAFIGCKPSLKLRIGGEVNYMKNYNNLSGRTSYGFSGYSSYYLSDKAQIFVRYDRLINEQKNEAGAGILSDGNAFLGGVSYTPVKGVHLSLNFRDWIPDNDGSKHKSNVSLSMEFQI